MKREDEPPEGNENWRRNHLCGACDKYNRRECSCTPDGFGDKRCYEPGAFEIEADELRREVRMLKGWLRALRYEVGCIGATTTHRKVRDLFNDALRGKPAPRRIAR